MQEVKTSLRQFDPTETGQNLNDILSRELELLRDGDLAFKVAYYVLLFSTDELQRYIAPTLDGLAIADNTFLLQESSKFTSSLLARDPNKKNPEFQKYVGAILLKWGIYAKEIKTFIEGLSLEDEVVFRLYRQAKFESLKRPYLEVSRSSDWPEISSGLDHGAVLALAAMRSDYLNNLKDVMGKKSQGSGAISAVRPFR